MKQPDLIRVCSLAEIPEGEARAFDVEGYDIAIFNSGDGVYALENRCPHMGAPLADGEMINGAVCCHDHGWMIDLDTGEVIDRGEEAVATFPVTVEDGEVFIQLG
jgi:nitrite reductase/ring-hydroxylating ferredoxin subunit